MSTYQNVIFLDIDGVLATKTTYKLWNLFGRPTSTVSGVSHLIDPENARRVRELMEEFNAQVVVSSAWRTVFGHSMVTGILEMFGIPVSGFTQDLGGRDYLGHRGTEIQKYCEDHGIDPLNIVILEDDRDVSPNSHRQVQPKFESDDPTEPLGFSEQYFQYARNLFLGR
jgi:hypothetical protein